MTAATKLAGIGAPLAALTFPTSDLDLDWDELWVPTADSVFTDTAGTTAALDGQSVKNCTLHSESAGTHDLTEATNPPTFQLANADFGGRSTLNFTTSQTISVESARTTDDNGSLMIVFKCATNNGVVIQGDTEASLSLTRVDGTGWRYKHGLLSTTDQGTADGNVHVALMQFRNLSDEWRYSIDGTYYSGDGIDFGPDITTLTINPGSAALEVAAVGWSESEWDSNTMDALDTAIAFDFNLS